MSVVILDFGSQYTRLIARRIRELNAFSVVLPGTAPSERIRETKPRAIVLSGGPRSVFDNDAPKPVDEVYDLGVPILGVCYGMHLLAERFGGRVVDAGERSYGSDRLVRAEGPLFEGMDPPMAIWIRFARSVRAVSCAWQEELNLVSSQLETHASHVLQYPFADRREKLRGSHRTTAHLSASG